MMEDLLIVSAASGLIDALRWRTWRDVDTPFEMLPFYTLLSLSCAGLSLAMFCLESDGCLDATRPAEAPRNPTTMLLDRAPIGF